MTDCLIGEKRHPADLGHLCRGHVEKLGNMLRQIEDEALHLDARPSMAIRTGSGKGSLASEQVAVRIDVLAFRDRRTKRWEPETELTYVPPAPKSYGPWCLFCDHETCTAWRAGRRRDLHDDEHDAGSEALASVLEELHNWARLVREERELSVPEHVTLTGERDALTRNLLWIIEQPWVDECYRDLSKLVGQLRRVNQTFPDAPEGQCYMPTAAGGECGGNIWRRQERRTVWRVHPDRCALEPVKVTDGEAYCEECGRVWSGVELDRLHLILEQMKSDLARPKTADGVDMLTAAELVARGIVSSVSNVRVTAHRSGLRAVGGYYDPRPFDGKVSA